MHLQLKMNRSIYLPFFILFDFFFFSVFLNFIPSFDSPVSNRSKFEPLAKLSYLNGHTFCLLNIFSQKVNAVRTDFCFIFARRATYSNSNCVFLFFSFLFISFLFFYFYFIFDRFFFFCSSQIFLSFSFAFSFSAFLFAHNLRSNVTYPHSTHPHTMYIHRSPLTNLRFMH